MKTQGRGVAFIGSSFVVGLFGDPTALDLDALKEVAGVLSSKPTGGWAMDKVSFAPKGKGKKAINVTGVCSFMISGAGMKVEKLAEALEGMGI